MSSESACIYKIDRLNTHNGEGFRTVIYLKGCPLHCSWCHNPEGMSSRKEVWIQKGKCIGCGICILQCPEKALTFDKNGIEIDRLKCTGCQACAEICTTKAIEKIGEEYSVDEVVEILKKDKKLFDTSNGGVTLTGGEPGNYPNFVSGLFKECQKEGIHTALDTSGAISQYALDKILPYTNHVFLDIKIFDNTKSEKHTGISFSKVLKTLFEMKKRLDKLDGFKLEIRTPLIPGITDTKANLEHIGQFLISEFPEKKLKWELCMFNDLCEDKYLKLDKEWRFAGGKHTKSDYKAFNELQKQFKDLQIVVTGFISKNVHKTN